MEVLDAVKARRSVREYDGRPVEREKLDLIIDAGRLAPTARNEQRVRVVIADGKKEIDEIAAASYPWVSTAPCVIAVYADHDRTMMCGISSKVEDCCIALTSMMLEAVSLGFGTVWMGHFDAPRVKKALGIPEDAILTAIMPVGYAADEGAPKEKLSREEFASFGTVRRW